MTEYVTGQIYGWNGGECPVHPKTKIKIWTRSWRPSGVDTDAGSCSWKHINAGSDLVCFQVITSYIEPKTIWVNEYADGRVCAYTSEEAAKRAEGGHHIRVAVKYVEVKE